MAQQMLQGKVVVVGAGAKHLGGLISRTFGADGAAVVVHYNSDATKAAADETVRAVHAAGGDAFAIQSDLTKVPAVVRLFDEANTRYGRLDIAVNTVGKVLKKPFVETTEAEYDNMFAINAPVNSETAKVRVPYPGKFAVAMPVRLPACRTVNARSSRTWIISAASMARNCSASAVGWPRSRNTLPLPRTSSKSSLLMATSP